MPALEMFRDRVRNEALVLRIDVPIPKAALAVGEDPPRDFELTAWIHC